MPTYEYKCNKCEHLFEAFQSMKDRPLKKCPECGGEARRVISGDAGVIFKGTGFYQTDYKKTSSVEKDKAKDIAPCGKNESCSSCKEND